MRHFWWATLLLLTPALLFSSQLTGTVYAAGDGDLKGWEKDSQYNALYQVEQYQKIKGTLVDIIEVTPFPDMSPGLGMIFRLRDGEMVTVHLAPSWFAKFVIYAFKKGDPVKAKGCWAEIGGKKVFMASKVRNGEYFEIKFRRTKDGTPYWTMTPEEITQERLEN